MSKYVSVSELSSINPLALETLLTSTGWRQIAARDDMFRVFESPDSNTDILIPLNSAYGDYLTRLNEALLGVEKNFGRRAEILLSQLIVGPMDEMSFEREVETLRGSIEWHSGERLYEAARKAFRAAAKSSEEHLPYFGTSRQRGPARRFINGIRMGQTKESSYVITALVPIRSDFEMTVLPGLEDYRPGFFRGVTANLMQAAEAAVEAAVEYRRRQSFNAFIESVDYGVSGELVDALAKLTTQSQEVRISSQWSPLVDEPVNIPSEVIVTPDHVPAFVTASARFKRPTAVSTVTVTGTVRGLERPKFGEAGISRIDVLSGISARRLRARLSREQYEAAIEAHRGGLALRMTGELSREGNLFWLYNVRNIERMPASDIADSLPADRQAALRLPFDLEPPPDDSDAN
jgi:hypothetical protein